MRRLPPCIVGRVEPDGVRLVDRITQGMLDARLGLAGGHRFKHCNDRIAPLIQHDAFDGFIAERRVLAVVEHPPAGGELHVQRESGSTAREEGVDGLDAKAVQGGRESEYQFGAALSGEIRCCMGTQILQRA